MQKICIFRFRKFRYEILSTDSVNVTEMCNLNDSLSQIHTLIDLLNEAICEGNIYFTDWPYSLSTSGYALNISKYAQKENIHTHEELLEERLGGEDIEKLNLWGTRNRQDFMPLCKHCTCSTCKNYTRSYIHHLLCVHEFSAQLLLLEHNTQQFKKLLELKSSCI